MKCQAGLCFMDSVLVQTTCKNSLKIIKLNIKKFVNTHKIQYDIMCT